MTVSAQPTIFQYVGNGVTTVFAYNCQVLQPNDLYVYVNGVAVTTGITKGGIGSLSGGTVTFSVAPANGAQVILEREVVLERTTDYQQNGDFLARVVNPDFNRIWMAIQQLLTGVTRSLKFPKTDVAPITELPGAAARADKLLSFDSSGNPVVIAPAAQSATALALSLIANAGSSIVGFIQAGLGAVGLTTQAKLRQVVNIKDFGALPGNTNAQNKAALQLAITALNAASGGVIVVDYDICYGVKTRTPSTWPDFTGTTKPIIIQDSSRGFTQDPLVYPAAYDGAQYRVWANTPQTTSPGQHDGNGTFMRGNWNPYFFTSNDANLAAAGTGTRTASDNYRNGFTVGVDGYAAWAFMNGTFAGSTYTKEELSNLQIGGKFSMPGDTLGDYVAMVVERKTGNISYGIGANIPAAHHYFGRVPGSPALSLAMLASDSTLSDLILRNSSGVGQDVGMENNAGNLNLRIVSQGIAVSINKDTRRVTFNKAVQFTKVNITYAASMTPNADAGNIFQIFANNATAFTINAPSGTATPGQEITIRISNVTAGALGALTWGAGIKAAAWTQPAAGFGKCVKLYYDDSTPAWIQSSAATPDVPN